MKKSVWKWNWLATLGVIALAAVAFAPGEAWAGSAPCPGAALERGFLNPPEEARPWVYWFWLNGNITREGITADLESMKRVGIGGVLIMEVDQGAPVGPVGFMSPQWRQLFQHVVAEAKRLGLEVNMNNDAGWNGSGGPWIKPEQSMQKVVFSETNLIGPRHFEVALPQPAPVAGFYRDIAVLAFPTTGSFRLDNIKVKAAYEGGSPGPTVDPGLAPEMIIDRNRILNLTSKMNQSGRLTWDVPAGRWTVLRLGHTSTGVENAPAPASGRGLECDKLSKEGIEANFAGMMAKLIADVGADAGKTLTATHIDSWENGSQNWTARMAEEFKKRRGYELLPWLPVMTGRVVGSLDQSDRFLWDLRQTISELVIENYAGHMRQLANQHGLKLTIEAYGSPCDHLPYAGQCDEPMGEFWVGGGALETLKGMASAAHIYGKRIVGAESFTADDREKWKDHPASIKALGDQAFCQGINRFVFHRYAMQPWLDRRPGMTMGPWGVHYERTQTWWEWTPAWHQYLARCQFLLRQGLFVADICYLEPEAPFQGLPSHKRQGYEWDQCCPEVVLTRMTVKDGRLVLPDGMSYRLLVLPEARTMTPALLGKIKELVQAGATVLGPRPLRSPSLAGFPKCDEEVQKLAAELWGPCDGQQVQEHQFGKGRVIWGPAPEKVLAKSGISPDFASSARLGCIHRQVDGVHLYFVANPLPHEISVSATFRVSGRVPELWWPDTGRIERAALYEDKNGVTSVSLPLGPSGSVFVVFRDARGSGDSVVAVSRDGKPVLSAAVPPPLKVVVHKAVYGVPGDPQRTRDARAQVQRKVDGGDFSFRVAQLVEGGDPAPKMLKTLVVDYSIGDQRFSVRAQDYDVIYLTGEGIKAVVNRATYGVPGDPKRTRDVRNRVQRLIDAGENHFTVARMAEGDDPAYLVVKTLVLEYTLDGKRITATGTDPETIYLMPTGRTEHVATLHYGPKGQLELEAWQPGKYELTFASGRKQTVTVPPSPRPLEIRPWNLRFPPNTVKLENIVFNKLSSWTELPETAARFFSGTGTYTTQFKVPQEIFRDNKPLYLDLGQVEVMAQVKVNGRDLGLLWKPPYMVDVTNVLVPGKNTIEVRVVNLWPNRLIGDEEMPEDSARNPDGTLKEWPKWLLEGKPSPTGRRTFTTWRLWKKGDKLLESGLIGPVTIRAVGLMPVP